jgi:hypothetical protein
MRSVISSVILLTYVASFMPSAFGTRPKTTPVVAKFGGECEGAPFRHSTRLESLIQRAKKREVSPCDSAFCGGTFAYDLNGDGKKEFFVRLSCGATGNCTWGVFSDNPARQRGIFTAWFFYIHRRAGSWSALSTYTREGGERGVITTLAYHRGRYVQTSERIEHGDYRDPQPFLTRMGVPKCS